MSIVDLLIYLVLWGVVLYVLWWALGKIAPPEPFYKIGQVVLVILTVYVILGPLLGFITVPHMTFTR